MNNKMCTNMHTHTHAYHFKPHKAENKKTALWLHKDMFVCSGQCKPGQREMYSVLRCWPAV